jgi:conjugal transfer ATP-binding protein TraC
MEALLTSLRTKHGQYAEVLISGPLGYAVTRLMLDPFSQTLYSTTPSTFAAIEGLVKEGLPLVEAIQHVADGAKGSP